MVRYLVASVVGMVLVLLGMLWLIAALSDAAPAPVRRPRPAPPAPPAVTTADVCRLSRYHWGAAPYDCVFMPSGICRSISEGGAVWEGNWSLRDAILRVEEVHLNGSPTDFGAWAVRLEWKDGKLTAVDSGSLPWKLETNH